MPVILPELAPDTTTILPMRKGDETVKTKVSEIDKAGVRRELPRLMGHIAQAYFQIGALLYRVVIEDQWKDWPAQCHKCTGSGKNQKGNECGTCAGSGKVVYEDFADFSWHVLGHSRRKSYYLIGCYVGVRQLNLPAAEHKAALTIGWTKLVQILRVAKTVEDFRRWHQKALMLSADDLTLAVKKALNLPDAGGTAKKLIVKATVSDETAYDAIEMAFSLVKRTTGIEDRGKALSMMCAAYMADHPHDREGGIAVKFAHVIENIERVWGCQLKIVVPPKESAVAEGDQKAEGAAPADEAGKRKPRKGKGDALPTPEAGDEVE